MDTLRTSDWLMSIAVCSRELRKLNKMLLSQFGKDKGKPSKLISQDVHGQETESSLHRNYN